MKGNSQITPEQLYLNRRRFLRLSARHALELTTLCGAAQIAPGVWAAEELARVACSGLLSPEHDNLTDYQSITHYNNYYEFSPNKEAVAILAKELTLLPWSIEITGDVEQPITLTPEDIINLGTEERTYHLRCVEGWSMVIPWTGVPLCKVLGLARPRPEAHFVRFTGTLRPSEMIGQRRNTLDWPYTEGLRLDEALHPLTLLATGLYGKALPSQNGAPVRLVVPWKYGFKSIKAIQKIELITEQPQTTWMQIAPDEYGFYANVNPKVPHPRWNQRKEVRVGELKKRDTRPFNGYSDQVAHLYEGMDLSVHF